MSIFSGFNTFALQNLFEANEDNDAKATAYEARVAMHLHDKTGAKNNQNAEFRSAHEATVARYKDRMAKISPKDQEEVERTAKTSAEGYLKSLKSNHGIDPKDVHEVHHTAKGIDKHVGKKVNQLMNPHDVLIKTKNGKMHGASLKMSTKSPTVNNSTMQTYDDLKKESGLESNAHDMWSDEKKKRGYDKMTNKALKAHMKSDPTIRDKEAADHLAHRSKIAKSQADNFNKGSFEQRKEFLQKITKSNPDLDYDYTAGDKDYSVPISKHPAIEKIKAAKDLKAVHNGSSSYAIHDHEGNQLFHFDFRTNHGPWVGPVATGKFGNLKPTAAAQKASAPSKPTPQKNPQVKPQIKDKDTTFGTGYSSPLSRTKYS